MKDKSPSIEEESSTLNGEYRERQNTDVAIIGISGRFAASANLEAFWSHLEGGESCIEPIKRADWETNTDADPAGVNTTQVKRGGMLEGMAQFDPLLFTISPLEAARMDPQQRVFLEEAYKAIEDAGYPAEQLSERKVGVFVGARPSDYKELCRGNRNGTCSHQKLPSTQEDQIDAHLFLGNDMGILAARISYFFNCKGPSLTIDTTSSSSLVAIHLACESIRTGESEMALVGGVFVMSSPEYYLMAEKTQMLSPDGKCKTFDKSANGIVLGEGVGALVLKRLDAAIEDRDHLYGVIKGSALNQDGRTLGMTAPSLHSQKALLSDLYKKTAIHPETVSYIEAHGTGSKLGDPIEVQALTEAFRQFTDKKQFCAIGSHKPNIGHTVSSAGVAGVLKVLLAMKYQRIPPSINIEEANPQIDFEGSPFFLNTEIREWKRGDGSLRRAGISSFGLSGTNCHLILEEPPPQKQIAHEEARPSFFFPLSAKTKESLAQKVEDMIKWLEKEGATYSVENISYTLIQGRSHFPIRSAVVARDTHDLLHTLRAMMSKGISQHEETNKKGKVSEQTEPLLREYACLLIKELTDKNLKHEEYDQKLNSLAKLYIKGCNSDWGQLFKKGRYHRVPLPTYPFLRESYWIKTREGVGIGGPGGEASLAGFGVSPNPPIPQNVLGFCTSHEGSQGPTDRDKLQPLCEALSHIVSRLLNVRFEEIDAETPLSEYGFDSITFRHFANHLNQTYQLDLAPALFFEYSTLDLLAQYLHATYASALASHFPPVPSANISSSNQIIRDPPVGGGWGAFRGRFFCAPPSGAGREGRSGETPETPPGAAPLDPTAKKPTSERRGGVERGGNLASTLDTNQHVSTHIAIVGMSGAFPQAPDVQSLWRNLLAGRDCIGEIPPSRWDWQSYVGNTAATEARKTNVKWAGIVEDIELFDPLFFGISRTEAEQMDPQQRILMMYVWKAIEDAGYSAERLSGTNTGLFVGTTSSGYSERVFRTNIPIEGYSSTGMTPSIGPNRMSYFLNLHGPSEAIETACSSSLVALHRGVNAIESGQCSTAIVGGVNTLICPELHISYSKAGMLSEDGRCKTFSAEANGYVRSEGVGILVLKKLSDAERAGDHIYGVIVGSAENHGGRASSLTAPNPRAQADLLIAAYRKAGIDPRTVGYIEAHGTGTPLGDPIEINGLKTAFSELAQMRGEGPLPQESCGLGSVKSNIGHLELAAGVAGVIKVLLQLQHKKLVKSLHCEPINPSIQLEGSPFYIVRENQVWEALRDRTGNVLPRRAGVSSFGFGGVNAHVVLEEYVPTPRAMPSGSAVSPGAIIVLSARSEERLHEQVRQLLAWVQTETCAEGQAEVWPNLQDLAYTLQVGRDAMGERLALQVSSLAELEEKLGKYLQEPQKQGDWYRGQVKQHKEVVTLVSQDEELQEAIGKWFQGGKYEKLLKWWVKGLKIDWTHLYGEHLPRRISLPTYPFARER